MKTNGERADAARNRKAILAAADLLFAQRGVERVTIEDISMVASVGKGTIYRRFQSRNGVVLALLDLRVNQLREALTADASPLGPDGPPMERLEAFIRALFDFSAQNRPLIRALEDLGRHSYYENATSQFWLDELRRRINGVTADCDAEYLAHAVYTLLRADVLDHLVEIRGMTADHIRDKLMHVVNAVFADASR